MTGTNLKIVQSSEEGYLLEACINKWVLGVASVDGLNCNHVIKSHYKFGVTYQVRPGFQGHHEGEQFQVCYDVCLLHNELEKWGVKVETLTYPPAPTSMGSVSMRAPGSKMTSK